jgi:hypothetical protein
MVAVVGHAVIEGARCHGVVVAVGRTGKDVTERVVCGICWICLREGEGISIMREWMREWLGDGRREWIKMARGGGYHNRGVNIRREERRHTSYPTLPFQHNLGFRKPLHLY